tara:strand:+ start:879 stop:1187 length:309 start_codon:yes stop_codon:yes gene_type:complete
MGISKHEAAGNSAPPRSFILIEDLPEESIGKCINHHKCFQDNVELANGLCVGCWDKAVSTASTGQRSDMVGITNKPRKKNRGASITKSTFGKQKTKHPYDRP